MACYIWPNYTPLTPDGPATLCVPYEVRQGTGWCCVLDETRYLNSGCFAGYANALHRATGRILSKRFDNDYVLRTRQGNPLQVCLGSVFEVHTAVKAKSARK